MALSSSCFFSLLIFFFLNSLAISVQSDGHETFIVHVSKSHKPHIFTTHHNWYSSILRSVSSSSQHSAKILYSYDYAARGFSARITSGQADRLRRVPGVVSVIPDRARQLHTTHTPTFLGLADSFGLWPNSDYADDVIVGVLDTGIWPERPSFSDDGLSAVPSGWKGKCETGQDFPATSCNRKIIGARLFYKGYEADRGSPIDESKESKSPRDTEGHGTHTASTAAGSVVANASFFQYAKGEARGMAVKARIAAYKICWKTGCFDSDILAAMDQAVADGVHVISLSVGADGYAPEYDVDSIAIGAFGHYLIKFLSDSSVLQSFYTAVNVAPWILTVAASTIDREFPANVILGDGRIFGGVSLYSGDPLNDTKLPLVYSGDCGSQLCYPGKLDPSKVAGKIVLCDRGGNARVEKGSAVKLAGGAGMVLANLADSGEELVADSHLLPATMVGQKAGDKIRDYVKSDSSPKATIVFKGTVIGKSPTAPRIAAFSGRGPNYVTPEILKPDVTAPGVNILAGWTGSIGPTDLEIDTRRVEFNIISGTSMSCPHVSGLAALLRKAYPKWTTAAIKSALMTTAYNVDNSGKTFTDLATGQESSPFVHGSGHVDPNRALDPGLVYDIEMKDYVNFLCAIGYDPKRISPFVKETSSVNCSEKSFVSPGDLNYPSFSVVFSSESVVKYKRVVKNVGRNTNAVYEVKISVPASVEVKVTPTKLSFSEENKSLSYEISFSSNGSVGLETVKGLESAFGSIEWSDGIHSVRSPIAVYWLLHSATASQ
ncbi:LOW QUALITY PROTEIN: subtilisin-like protease SBT1.4 [Nicotiana tabacum]|uniref:LOW QUALITY PROTEIN: subtilisin-like protease SBT1.4 n=1 Tax=Nicotiana tabacum TaxID=4097 RepID=A0A1S3YWW9_TOBAC